MLLQWKWGLDLHSVLQCLDLERAERLAHRLRGKLLLSHGELVNLSAFCVRHVANILAQVTSPNFCFEGAPYEPKTSQHDGMSRRQKADKLECHDCVCHGVFFTTTI